MKISEIQFQEEREITTFKLIGIKVIEVHIDINFREYEFK